MTDDRAEIDRKLRYLFDRQEILDCVTRNSRGNDRFDQALVASSYHVDGWHELGHSRIPGPEYGDHANASHAAISDVNLHNVTMQSCEIDGDVAHAESYVIGVFADKGAQTSRMLAGRYIDRLERRDGEWRIVSRRVAMEWVSEEMDESPLGPGGYKLANFAPTRYDDSDPSYERNWADHG